VKRSEIQTGKTYHNISKPPFYAERKVTAIFKSQAEEDGRQYVRFHTITGPLSHYEREGYPDGEMLLEAFARWAAGVVE
jgi:hypothetical protein